MAWTPSAPLFLATPRPTHRRPSLLAQELYLWPEVAEAGRQALSQRYRLLPYLYSTMRAAHDTGAPAMRPLWMTFPEDVAGHRNDRQFMFGDALLVTPVLTQGARSVEGHFPPGTWYSLWNASDVVHARCAALGIQRCVRV